jgi:hypothetical protein
MEREPIVGRQHVDGRPWRIEQVGAALHPLQHRADETALTAQEAPDVVTELAVPLRPPCVWEVAASEVASEIPRLSNQANATPLSPVANRPKVKSQPVDAEVCEPVERREQQLLGSG